MTHVRHVRWVAAGLLAPGGLRGPRASAIPASDIARGFEHRPKTVARSSSNVEDSLVG